MSVHGHTQTLGSLSVRRDSELSLIPPIDGKEQTTTKWSIYHDGTQHFKVIFMSIGRSRDYPSSTLGVVQSTHHTHPNLRRRSLPSVSP